MSKKIFPSSGNGKGAESSVVTVDENNGNVSAASVTASYITVDGLNGLAKISSGQISSLDITTAQSGNILQSQGGQFIPKAASLQALGGDLDGLVSNAIVNSISNITSGTLSINVGGTGKNSLTSGSILALNQPNIDATSGSLLTVNSDGNAWQTTGSAVLDVVPLAEPIIYLYTGSAGTSNTFTWTKPEGARFIRVICQGGGGGGGCGNGDDGAGTGHGGAGGGGGGYSHVTFNAFSISKTVNVTAGGGGLGGVGIIGSKVISRYSSAGGSSLFGGYIFSEGGGAGPTPPWNSTSAYAGGAGGGGMTASGGSGGSIPGRGAVSTDGGSVAIGAPGGGAGANTIAVGRSGGSITGYITGPSGGSAGSTSVLAGNGNAPQTLKSLNFFNLFINNVQSFSMPNLMCAGGAGGGGRSGPTSIGTAPLSPWKAGDGSSATFGAGGGGGGRWDSAYTSAGGNGGNGGVGYVLIICY